MCVGEMYVGEMSVGEMSVTHFQRCVCRRNVLSAISLSAKRPVSELSVGECLSVKCPSTVS